MTQPLSLQYAGFGRRLVAQLVDVLVALLTVLLASMVIRALRTAGIFHQPADLRAMWAGLGIQVKLVVIVGFLVSLGAFYFPLCHASPAQATLGKRTANIYVIARDGSRLGFLRALARWFVQALIIPPFGWQNLISIITILADRKSRAVHDFVVGSAVVIGAPPGRPKLAWRRVTAAIGIQMVWLVITIWLAIDSSESYERIALW